MAVRAMESAWAKDVLSIWVIITVIRLGKRIVREGVGKVLKLFLSLSDAVSVHGKESNSRRSCSRSRLERGVLIGVLRRRGVGCLYKGTMTDSSRARLRKQ